MTTAVVIGGGIAGLASAALLARDGYDVTLLEKRDQLGGRAGSWEKDGFRFDTGPSWYLMPEVFDHFFRLMGTTAAEQLRLVSLDPGYRVIFEGVAEPLDIAASREENLELFESIEKGSRARMERYLASAAETYEIAKRRFLYTSFASIRPAAAARRALAHGHARAAAAAAARVARRAHRARSTATPGARLPRGLPRVVAI